MRKVLLFVSLFITASMMSATTITKTAAELQSMHNWQAELCYYQPFALDDVITVSSTYGQAKYNAKPAEMRYYQWCDDGIGSMVFKAKAGYVITSIRLKYAQTTARTVPCIFWYNENKVVPVCDTLPNNVERSFYSNQVVLYIGNTAKSSGQLRVQEYSVTYEEATLDRMYTKSAIDLGMQYGWAHGTHPQNITLNDMLSLHSDKTTLKYYMSDRVFACYQANGKFWFNARNGVTIKNIRLYYFPQTPSATSEGVLCLSENFGTDGKSIDVANQIVSGQTVAVNAGSVSFNCGNKFNASGAQIRITGFQIEYSDANSQMETFSNLTVASGSSEVKFMGDNGNMWKVNNFAHRDSCAMYDYLGTRLFYNGYIATDGVIEGGIKNVSFEWRMEGDTNAVCPLKDTTIFTVTAGSKSDVCTQTQTTKTAGHYMNYTKAFEVKENCAFSINVGAKENPAQTQPVFGPVTITPYLLFAMREDSVYTQEVSSYDLSAILIDNTEDAANIVYSIESDGTGGAAINGSEVDLSGVTQSGQVVVKTAWESVTAHFTLNVKVGGPTTGWNKVHNAQCTMHNGKVIEDGELRIYRDGTCYSVLGEIIK